MGRIGIMLVSLVAALPGVALTYFVVMAFWDHAESMNGMLLGLSAITLIVSAAAVLMPIGIFLFTPKPAAAQASDAAVPAAASDEAIAAAESGEVDFEAGPATMDGIAVAESSDTLDGIALSDSEIAAGDEEFDLGDIEPDADGPFAETTEEDFDWDLDGEKN